MLYEFYYYLNNSMEGLYRELVDNGMDLEVVEVNTIEVKNDIDLSVVVLNNSNVDIYTIIIADDRFMYNRKTIGLDETVDTIKTMLY